MVGLSATDFRKTSAFHLIRLIKSVILRPQPKNLVARGHPSQESQGHLLGKNKKTPRFIR